MNKLTDQNSQSRVSKYLKKTGHYINRDFSYMLDQSQTRIDKPAS